MKLNLTNSKRALTRIEVLVIIAVLVVLAIMLMPAVGRAKARAQRITCISHLKFLGFGNMLWTIDFTNSFPMGISTNAGGTEEYVTTGEAFRHFQALSNKLNTPLVFVCPSDVRRPAKDFESLRNANISYFVGLDASEIYPATVLSGDRNITNGSISSNGILEVTSGSVVGWTAEMHNKQGNVLLSDSSVQAFSTTKLRVALASSGVATNHLAFPLD